MYKYINHGFMILDELWSIHEVIVVKGLLKVHHPIFVVVVI